MSTVDSQLTQRNGSLSDLATLLCEQHAAKLDVVIPAAGIRSAGADLLVIDLDGPCGHGRFTDLAADAEPVPTFTVATPSGGEHPYYRVEPGAPAPSTVRRLGPQIDTRGAGGYVVAPGSARLTVHRRRHCRVIDGRPPAAIPAWIAVLLQPRARVMQPMRSPTHGVYGQAAVSGDCALVRRASPGTRKTILFQAAVRLGTLVGAGVHDQQHVHEQLRGASTVHSGVAGFTAAEAERAITMDSGTGRPVPDRSGDR